MATKILVLENTEGIADMLSFSRTADYDVFSAANSKEAISVLDQKRPHLLVCDVNIPDMDGIEFLCHVKKHYPQIEVIIISDLDNREMGFQCLKYEASDFIVKPVTNNSLDIVLERAKRKIAIRRKLSPSSNDSAQLDGVPIERLSIARQILKSLSASKQGNIDSISGIISIHNPSGIVIEASKSYMDLIGNMTGRSSWEMYTGKESTREACPCSIAVKTKKGHFQEATLKTNKNAEIAVDVFTTPLLTSQNTIDMVIEIINLK